MKLKGLSKAFHIVKYPLLLVIVLGVSLFVAYKTFKQDVNNVFIQYDGQVIEVSTTGTTVEDALSDADITLDDGERINCNLDDSLDDVYKIVITKPNEVSITLEGENFVVMTFSETIEEVFVENDIEIQEDEEIVDAEPEDEIEDGMVIEVVKKELVYWDESEVIPHETVYEEDSTMLKGEYETAVFGKDGLRTVFYETLLENDEEVYTEIIGEEYTAPVTTVVKYGVIENFTNSIGQVVAYSKSYEMSATAYSPTPENWGYSTYSGNTNREGGVAVDPSVIPLGTKLYVKGLNGMPDYGFAIAWDVGNSIKGNKIDLFMEDEDTCVWWGIKDVEVYVLYDQSVDIFLLRNNRLFVND